MIEKTMEITTEYIKLQDLLKFANVVIQGGEAKHLVLSGACKVNDELCLQRGRKIYEGMLVVCNYEGETYQLNVKNK